MTYPQAAPVDERLLAVLRSAVARDPNALSSGDHLQSLLADLAPDMPVSLRNACVAAAAARVGGWLTNSPPYSEDQVVGWLRAQYPDLQLEDLRQSVAAFAVLSGARPAPTSAPSQPAPAPAPSQPASVFAAPTVAPPVSAPAMAPPPVEAARMAPPVAAPAGASPSPIVGPIADRPTVGGVLPNVSKYPSEPPMPLGRPATPGAPPPWIPAPAPGPGQPANRRGRMWLIIGIVAVLLAGAGIGAAVVLSGGSHKAAPKPLAAPLGLRAVPYPHGGVHLSWQRVSGATGYQIVDRTGRLPATAAKGTSHTFAGAGTANHIFVVRAASDSGKLGPASASVTWHGVIPLTAPTGLTATAKGFDVEVSWSAVRGATGYVVRDTSGSGSPQRTTTTSATFSDAVYGNHHFEVAAIGKSQQGPSAARDYAPTANLTTAEQALAYKIPDTVGVPGSCTSITVTNAAAAVKCTPVGSGPQTLFALRAQNGVKPLEHQLYPRTWRHLQAGCSNSVSSDGTHGTWHPSNAADKGDFFCFPASGGTPALAWSYWSDGVILEVTGSTHNTLFSWWYRRAPSSLRD